MVPDGKLLAAQLDSRVIHIWDAADGYALAKSARFQDRITTRLLRDFNSRVIAHDYAGAKELIQQVLVRGWVFSSREHRDLAVVHFHLEEYSKALVELRRAVDLDPDSGVTILRSIPLEKVSACSDEGFRNGFLELADRIVQQNEGFLRARLTRLSLLVAMGLTEQALPDCEQILELRPGAEIAMICNNIVWSIVRYPGQKRELIRRALALAERAVKISSDEGTIWNTLGAPDIGPVNTLQRSTPVKSR